MHARAKRLYSSVIHLFAIKLPRTLEHPAKSSGSNHLSYIEERLKRLWKNKQNMINI